MHMLNCSVPQGRLGLLSQNIGVWLLPCREEELRILRGEQDVGSPSRNSGKRGTAASAGGVNSGSSSDTEGGRSFEEGSWKGAGQAAVHPGQWGNDSTQQQQQQQPPGGSKVSMCVAC